MSKPSISIVTSIHYRILKGGLSTEKGSSKDVFYENPGFSVTPVGTPFVRNPNN